MSRNWTLQQKNAIYATDGSVLVSAAAGSGKTAVLVERVIQLITREKNPLDVDRLLIVTFTRAAAAEMRERIQAAVNKLLEDDPYNAHLLAQRQLLYSANISTIDSFCGDIVREYFHTLDVARDFVLPMRVNLKFSDRRHSTLSLSIFMILRIKNFFACSMFLRENRAIKNCVKQSLKFPSFSPLSRFPINGLMICRKNIPKHKFQNPCGETL